MAFDALISLAGSDALLRRATATIDTIREALPDDAMRRSFMESEVVGRLGPSLL
jgi:hypothetical protein